MGDKEKGQQVKIENEIPKEELKHVNGGAQAGGPQAVGVDETPGDTDKSPYFR